jgi:DNA-binding response OmpR family regulator
MSAVGEGMSTTRRVVLLGEPDEATSELYQRALRTAFDVIAIFDGDAILQVIRTRSLAALVLEPAIFADSSWQHLTTISQACAKHNVSLVICSTQDERRRGIELGAVYLLKPTLPALLLDTLLKIV